MELWKKFVTFEKSNPLRTEDTALITRRVMFATEQCLLVLTHHPAVWHQAAQFLDHSSKALADKGVRILLITSNSVFQLIYLEFIYKLFPISNIPFVRIPFAVVVIIQRKFTTKNQLETVLFHSQMQEDRC